MLTIVNTTKSLLETVCLTGYGPQPLTEQSLVFSIVLLLVKHILVLLGTFGSVKLCNLPHLSLFGLVFAPIGDQLYRQLAFAGMCCVTNVVVSWQVI